MLTRWRIRPVSKPTATRRMKATPTAAMSSSSPRHPLSSLASPRCAAWRCACAMRYRAIIASPCASQLGCCTTFARATPARRPAAQDAEPLRLSTELDDAAAVHAEVDAADAVVRDTSTRRSGGDEARASAFRTHIVDAAAAGDCCRLQQSDVGARRRARRGVRRLVCSIHDLSVRGERRARQRSHRQRRRRRRPRPSWSRVARSRPSPSEPRYRACGAAADRATRHEGLRRGAAESGRSEPALRDRGDRTFNANFYAFVTLAGGANVIRIINQNTVEFPLYVSPYCMRPHLSSVVMDGPSSPLLCTKCSLVPKFGLSACRSSEETDRFPGDQLPALHSRGLDHHSYHDENSCDAGRDASAADGDARRAGLGILVVARTRARAATSAAARLSARAQPRRQSPGSCRHHRRHRLL